MPDHCRVQGFHLSEAAILTAPLYHYIACPGFVESNAAQLSSTIFSTLPLYSDLPSQRAVLATLRIALSNETFLKTFAASLLRTDGAKVSRQESFILFLWSSAVLQALQLPAAAKAALKLLERQVRLLGATQGRTDLTHLCSAWQALACMPHPNGR